MRFICSCPPPPPPPHFAQPDSSWSVKLDYLFCRSSERRHFGKTDYQTHKLEKSKKLNTQKLRVLAEQVFLRPHWKVSCVIFWVEKSYTLDTFSLKTGFRNAILEIWPAFVSCFLVRMRSRYAYMSRAAGCTIRRAEGGKEEKETGYWDFPYLSPVSHPLFLLYHHGHANVVLNLIDQFRWFETVFHFPFQLNFMKDLLVCSKRLLLLVDSRCCNNLSTYQLLYSHWHFGCHSNLTGPQIHPISGIQLHFTQKVAGELPFLLHQNCLHIKDHFLRKFKKILSRGFWRHLNIL